MVSKALKLRHKNSKNMKTAQKTLDLFFLTIILVPALMYYLGGATLETMLIAALVIKAVFYTTVAVQFYRNK